MDRWSGVLKVPLRANSRDCYNVAASLCLSPTSNSLAVPSANAIFFSGDRVSGTGNPVIERLSSPQNIAEILVSKLGSGGCINAWVIEASLFNGPFAVYKDFIPSVNQWGEPKSYDPSGFPASESIVLLLSNSLQKVKDALERSKGSTLAGISRPNSSQQTPETLLFGFSKGGTVLNQILTELGCSSYPPHCLDLLSDLTPATGQSLLGSIREIHYVDVGLNSAGAYVTDEGTIQRIPIRPLRVTLHGTPRQWCDGRRPWIRQEKDAMLGLLRSRAMSEGNSLLRVSERSYFATGEVPPDMQMHFEIIEKLDLS